MKRFKMRKFYCAVLAFIMVLSLFAGCGNTAATAEEVASDAQSVEEAAPEAEAPEAPAASAATEDAAAEASAEESEQAEAAEFEPVPVELPIVEEPMTVTLWSIIRPSVANLVQDTSDLYLYGEIAARTNIDFDCTLVSLDGATEKFTLMAASDDFTDVVAEIGYYSTGVNGALQDEVVYDLYDYVLEYAPNYWNAVSSSNEAITTLINQEGQMGSLASIYKEPGLEATGLCVRGDWLEEFGIDEIVTYDDMYDYLTSAAKEKGVGMSLASDGQCWELSQGYGVMAGSYSCYDDQIQHFIETDGYYDYVVMMNKWYNEGLVDHDFISASGLSSLGMDFVNDKSSVGEFHAAAMVGLNGIAADPNAVYVSIPNAKVNADDEYTIGQTNSVFKNSTAWGITTKCDEDKVIALVKLTDYFYTDEGALLLNYGVEGYTFDYDAEGNPIFTEVITNNETYDQTNALCIYVTASVPGLTDQAREYQSLSDLGWEAIERFRAQNIGINCMPDNITSFLTNEESMACANVANDVDTHIETTVLSYITNPEAPSRETYDAFVQECVAMGLDQVDEYYQTAYDRYLENAAAYQ